VLNLKKIDKSNLKALLIGSQFLGSGGGGKVHLIKQIIDNYFDNEFSVDLIGLDELSIDEYGAAVGVVGSPEVIEEYMPTGKEGKSLLKKLSASTGNKIRTLFTVEGAGINLIYPLVVAYTTGLPIIDGDTMGRAFPEMQMTTFQFNNIKITPVIFQDVENNYHVYNNEDASYIDLNIRQKIAQINGLAFFTGYQALHKVLKSILIPNTYTFAINIGEAFIKSNTYDELLKNLKIVTKNSLYGTSIELVRGQINNINDMDNANISSYVIGDYNIYFHNENLMIFKNKKIIGSVPDLITIIDLERLKPINVTDIHVGQNVAIIGTPAPLQLRTPTALSVIGPKSFGFKSIYESLEKIYFQYYYHY
jgi:DUF917 family protein